MIPLIGYKDQATEDANRFVLSSLRTIALFSAIGMLTFSSTTCALAVENVVLHLSTGDHLAGSPEASDDSTKVRWAPEFAQGVYEFPWDQVSAMQFPRPEQAITPSGMFCFELHGGDLLFGDLTAVSEKWFSLERENAEPIELRRSSVRRISSWNNGRDLVYLGPDDLTEWKPSAKGSWQQASGSLKSRQKQVSIYRDVKLPAQSCIELEISWERIPDFSIGLGVDGTDAVFKQAFLIDVLANSVVAVRETDKEADLAVLRTVGKQPGRLHLLLYLDQAAGRLLVATPAGQTLADLRVVSMKAKVDAAKNVQGEIGKLVQLMRPGEDAKQLTFGGIQFKNREGDLTVDRLRVSRWDGRVPTTVKQEGTRIQLREGEAAYGKLEGFDSAQQSFTYIPTPNDEAADTSAGKQEISAESIEEIMFSGEPKEAKGSVRLSLHSGLRLRGELSRITEDSLIFSSSALKSDFKVPLDEVRTLVGVASAASSAASQAVRPAPDGQVARLEVSVGEGGQSSMKGILVPGKGDDQASCLHWQPRGSEQALPLLHDVSGRLVYRDPPIKSSPQELQRQLQARRRVQRPKLMNGLLNAFTGGNGSTVGQGGPAIYLRAGDKLPIDRTTVRIDSRGVSFKSPMTEATFVPHSKVKAIELITKGVDGRVTSDRRDQLLTLPRLQRDNPPTHLLVSIFGDYLRCRLMSLDDRWAVIEVRLEEQQIERKKIARIIWLGDPPPLPTDATESLDELPEGTASNEIADEAAPAVAAADEAFRSRLRVQAVRSDGVRLTFRPEEMSGKQLIGKSLVLSKCSVDLGQVDQLLLGERIEQAAAELAYQRWRMQHAADPREDDEEGAAGVDSALVGQPAPDMSLPFVKDGKLIRKNFKVSDYQGKVLVLDFWASWCGPCTQAMPMIDRLADEFADRNVEVVAVNMQESPAKIARALERMKVDPTVALDRDGVAAQRYQVSGIPQTVVIDREGKVARVFIGAGPKFEEQLRAILEEVSFPGQ